MTNLSLFDTRGRYTAPSPDILDKLTPDVRAAVECVGQASKNLETATAAVESNETKLAETRAEIVALEKIAPKGQTLNDLVKEQCRETQRRRMGL